MIHSVAAGALEVIVADGGSTDDTCALAEAVGATVIEAPRGRGVQMDEGARVAAGDVLLFLHADTRLDRGFAEEVEKLLADSRVCAGAFSLAIESGKLWFRVVERMANWRARYLGIILGDQAIFVRAGSFTKVGGFGTLSLMEDADCVKKLRGIGRVALSRKKALTSPRRWLSGGLYSNTLKNWMVLLLYALGVSTERLYRIYYGSQPRG